MTHIPTFDGGFESWCLAGAFVAAGAGAVIAGWFNLRLWMSAIGLSILVVAGVWIAPALAQDNTGDLEALLAKAQVRVDEAQSDLGEWAQGLQHRPPAYQAEAAAIKFANEGQMARGAGMMTDPALRGANFGPASQRPDGKGGVYLAVSLSMPPETLRALARDAHKAGVRVVIRGLVNGSFKETLVKIKQVFDDHSQGGVAIDPQVFKAFDVKAVPTFISSDGPVQPCGSLGCTPAAPGFDKVAGNISLEAALQLLADDGAIGQPAARAALDRLSG